MGRDVHGVNRTRGGSQGASLEDTQHYTYIGKEYFWKTTPETFNIDCLQEREMSNWGRTFH